MLGRTSSTTTGFFFVIIVDSGRSAKRKGREGEREREDVCVCVCGGLWGRWPRRDWLIDGEAPLFFRRKLAIMYGVTTEHLPAQCGDIWMCGRAVNIQAI